MKNLYFFLAVLLFCQIVKAQDGNYHRSSNPADHPENSTGNSGTGGNINVVYHRCDWTIDPSASKNIAGTVTTYFKTIAANVATITMDLNSTSFNNASLIVKYHGTTCTKTCASNILTITLPSTIVANNTLDSVSIAYSGVPPAVNSQAEGFQRKQDGSGNWYIYTLSESYEDRDWWPCKADMQDKIDSMDINITVPSAYWAAANGTLIDSAVNGANRTLKFKHRYPIASYLVAIGVAKYNRYYRGTVPIGGKNVPVVYYLFPDVTGTSLTNALNALDVSKQELALYSAKYGDYGFVDEKHGYYEFGWNGGMEHQTFSAMGAGTLTDWSVIAHELAHQWWGDKVSFATWNHLWLAEGFARYSEVLTAENINVGETALTHITDIKTTARATNSTPILLSSSSIANSNTVWTNNNNNAIYERGCMVASMLRATLGDNKFFKACKNYMSDPLLAYKSATTTDLQNHMETQAGVDMSSFFTAWVNGSGTPSYTGQYYVSGKYIQFKFTQSKVGGTTSFFPMPIVLKIANSGGTYDTTIVVYHYSATQLGYAGDGIGPAGKDVISYNLSFVPASVSFDPGNVTMATGTMTLTGTVLANEVQDLKGQRSTNGNEVDLTVINTEAIQKVTLYKSANGVDFSLAGDMSANGVAGNRLSYHFTDNNPFAPASFYRATITTATKSLLSNIVKIQSSTVIKKLTVSPNPASDMIAVNFNNDNKENTIVRVTAIDGKRIFESTTTNNFIHLDVSHLPVGTYSVQIIQGGKISESAKFLVSR